MNVCFWNINKKDLSKYLRPLLDENEIDLLFLAESDLPPSQILNELNKNDSSFFYCSGIVCEKIQIYSRFKDSLLGLLGEEHRITARQFFSTTQSNNITLICLHFQSKASWDSNSQSAHSSKVRSFIESIENTVGHKRTVVFGDFNMHPFDTGLVQTTGFHTTMEQRIAKKINRKVDGEKYDYFYNPMWSFLGDRSKGSVCGTMFYNAANPINYNWCIFDQVLMRPSIIDYFDFDYLDIITSIGNDSLLSKRKTINSTKFSDHLPIKFLIK